MTYTQSDRPISITTPLGPDVLLLRNFTFREELGRPFRLFLDLQSTNADLDFAAIIGQEVTITVDLPTYQKRYFHGVVSVFRQVGFSGELVNYRATVVPWLWLLSRTSDCRIYQNLTVPQIVQQVFQEFGFANVRDALTATYPELPFCVQYDETAFNFVSRLLERAGIFYYFDHTAEADTLVLCDAGTAPAAYPGYETIPYYPEKEVLHAPQHIYEWLIEQEVQPGSFTLDDYDYTNPKADLLETATISQPYANGAFERFHYPGNYQTEPQGEALANVRLQEEQARQTTQRGVSNALGLAAGYKFQLTNFPRQDQNAEMLTTALILRVTTADFSTNDAEPDEFSSVCQFRTLLLGRPFRPARLALKPRIAGPQTATVVGAAGQEVDPDAYGSVIVQFHWDRQGQSNEQSSCRIRVSQNSTGSQWGSMFIPHVGSEVVVSFENGDPDRPLIIGRVYNGDQTPPVTPTTAPEVSYIQDSSQQNLLSMDATDNAEKVVLQNAKNKITMDSTVGAPKLTITDGASTIVFDPTAGSVTTTTPSDQNQKNNGDTSHWTYGDWGAWVGGVSTTNVFGDTWAASYGLNQYIVIGGDLSVAAPFSVSVVKGWQYEHNTATKVFADNNVIEEFTRKTTTGARRTETIAGSDTLTVGGVRTEIFDELTTTCEGTSTEQVLGAKSLEAETLAITAPEITIEASAGVQIQCGVIDLSADTVVINGAIINIG